MVMKKQLFKTKMKIIKIVKIIKTAKLIIIKVSKKVNSYLKNQKQVKILEWLKNKVAKLVK